MSRAGENLNSAPVERAATAFGVEEVGVRTTRRLSDRLGRTLSLPQPEGMCRSCSDQARELSARQSRLMYLRSARALAAMVEARDPCTRQHSLVVSNCAVELGARLKLPPARLELLRIAALLHDIGKIGIPDAVLQKPGPLTPAEFGLIKQHPKLATDILGQAGLFDDELPIILHHHESYDGSGYPAGLAGRDIPFEARILNVADSLDAMLSPRSYKPGYGIERVRRELIACSGRQFDPRLVSVTVRWLDRHPDRFFRSNRRPSE